MTNNPTDDVFASRSPDQVFAELDGQVVMMSVRNGAYYSLDHMGSRIWDRIEEPVSVSTLCGEIVQEYDVTPEEARDDIVTFLRGLEAEGLVRLTDAG
ncbi:MAG TPA: lasso peptide biosynthesis PqqD family chaperone [Longimicrobiales bacterium]|jgi:TPP-dependent trihydroxycyclohexane-1,2-dione (THcHDO) dehydratase